MTCSRLGLIGLTSVLICLSWGCQSHRARSTSNTLKLDVGQSEIEYLPATAGTGYSWILDESGSNGLDLVKVEMVQAFEQPTDGRFGAAGRSVWRITGEEYGQASLRFVYRRPWEPISQSCTSRRVLVDIY